MTNYKYQTTESLVLEGELGLNASGQLITKDGSGTTVIVGGPANSTPVPDLAQTYAEEQMDISAVQTLGSGFIFLNGSTFDTMGVGVYEFEESDGTVYGLYGRTNGLAQQVYFSGAQTNTSTMQYTTVAYVPPFLSSSSWQAQCVVGSDLQGFTLQLRDTTPGSTASPRYIYVRHNGSLITTSGHTYVEITPVVNNYMGSVTHNVQSYPKIIRVGAYFFIALADWSNNSVWFAGWNAQDSTYPFTNAALPSSAGTYTPQTFTITTTGYPGGNITTGQSFPALFGSNAPGGVTPYTMYNVSSGTTETAQYLSAPQPATAQWTENLTVFLEGEVDSGGNPFLAFGCGNVFIAATTGHQANAFIVFSIAVQFTAGTAGAYTNAQLNYVQAGSSGSSLYNQQPGGPIYIGFNSPTGHVKPDETTQATLTSIPSCIGKLPDATYFTSYGPTWGGTPNVNWFYSGFQTLTASGASVIVRGGTKPAGVQIGSLAAARANKLANIYPMFNVTNRMDLNPVNGSPMTNSFFEPSGQMVESGNAQMVGPDIILTAGIDQNRQNFWCISKLPTNSQITDQTYNKFGTAVPGFGTRVAEYRTNLPTWTSTLSTWGAVWPTGVAATAPTHFNFPVCTDSGPFAANVNGAGVRFGQWSLSGSIYNAPPVTWTYASNMSTQLASLKSAALTAAQAASSGFGGRAVYGIEVVPIINSAGNGFSIAIGVLHGVNTSGIGEAFFFYTACGLTGSVINLTSTSTANPIVVPDIDANGLVGGYGSNDLQFGSLFVVYPTTAGGNFYVGWAQANGVTVVGDTINAPTFIQFSGSVSGTVAGGVVSVGSNSRSTALSYMSCSAQHDGLGIMPVRPGYGIPQIDIGLARYASTPISTVSDIINSFTAAIANPTNYVTPSNPASNGYASNNVSEMLVLNAINNTFLLQIGSISGRLNHKQFNLPSTFIDMTNYSIGTYYLYVTDTGAGGVQIQVDSVQRAESNTNTYFGTFNRTSTGFSNESSISEMIRFGTSRLVAGSEGQPIQGSQIRIGAYVG